MQGNNSKGLNDSELVEGYLESGELSWLGELYNRYIHLVYGVCIKYLKNREDARDGTMDIFEKITTELMKHEIDNFKSWLYVVTKNYCLMKIRGERAVRTIGYEEYHDSIMENGHELHPVDKDDGLADEDLKRCIEKLKKEQQKCIQMFYYEKMCYRDIADKMKIEEKKIKSHLQNAKRNLKICLEGKDEKEQKR